MAFKRNQKQLKSKPEEDFKKTYGSYPSENELKQFLPYWRTYKLDQIYNITKYTT